MSSVQHFTDLESWKINHSLVLLIYRLTQSFPAQEKFGIIDQLRRASSSVTANIAEGWGRYHFPDKIRFYHLARGSLMEVQNFLILSRDLHYLSKVDFEHVMDISEQGTRLINGLIRSAEKR